MLKTSDKQKGQNMSLENKKKDLGYYNYSRSSKSERDMIFANSTEYNKESDCFIEMTGCWYECESDFKYWAEADEIDGENFWAKNPKAHVKEALCNLRYGGNGYVFLNERTGNRERCFVIEIKNIDYMMILKVQDAVRKWHFTNKFEFQDLVIELSSCVWDKVE